MRPTLLGHSKFKRLVSILKCPRSHAVGYLEMIWQAAYESGDDFIGDAVDVELAAEWNGTPGELVKALLDCGGESRQGFIEQVNGGYAIHDLFDHAPDYVFNRSSREQERKKVKTCEYCNSTYHSPDRRSKYCSDNCRKSMSRDGKRQTETDKSVSETDCPRTPSPSPSPSPAPALKKHAMNTQMQRASEFDYITASPTELNHHCFEEFKKLGMDDGAALKLVNKYKDADSQLGWETFPRILFQLWHYRWRLKYSNGEDRPMTIGWLWKAVENDYKPPDEFKVPR